MPMTVLSVADPRVPMGSHAMDDAEQMLACLDEGLVRAGHRSIVIACAGSKCHGELIPLPRATGELDGPALERLQGTIERVLRTHAVDVLHVHGLEFAAYLPSHTPATLATLHQPPEWYPSEIFQHAPRNLFLHCVSQAQHERCPHVPHLLPPIAHGVRLEALWPARRKRNFALLLGRICPEKGFELALQAAHSAQATLLLAGELSDQPEHQRYFEQSIAPWLDARRRYIGPIDWARKRRLLGAARCLLVPSLVPETSSLGAQEALACGTPVIAFRNGALPELIEHGRTGWLVDNVDQMANALAAREPIASESCRRSAERQSSADAMVERYLAVYDQIRAPARASGHKQPAHVVRAQPSRIHELTTCHQLTELERPWRALYDSCPQATPEQSPLWLLPWCRAYEVQRIHVLTIYRGSKLLGIAPLSIQHDHTTGLRTLSLLGGTAAAQHDVLFDPLHASACLARLRAWLIDHRHEWDRCDFEQLRADSPLLQLSLPGVARASTLPQTQSTVLTLTAAAPELLQRELEAASGAGLRSEAATSATLPAQLSALFALRRTADDDPRFHDFLRSGAQRLAEHGKLQLHALYAHDQPAAAFYGIADKGRCQHVVSAVDPRWRDHDLTALLLAHVAQSGVRLLEGFGGQRAAWAVRAQRHAAHRHTLVQNVQPRTMAATRTWARARASVGH